MYPRIAPLFFCVLIISSAAVSAEEGSAVSSLPPSAQATISAAVGAGTEMYSIRPRKDGLTARNRAAQYHFSARGLEIRSSTHLEFFSLRSYGYGKNRMLTGKVSPRASRNRVDFVHEQITEWYVNGPLGLEQGLTLQSPPKKGAGALLTFEFQVSGDLQARVEDSGKNLAFTSSTGDSVFSYTGLTATDALGKDLPARLAIHGRQLLLQVDDRDARYPVIVDPWIAAGQLSPTPDGAYGFGLSIAIDGNTIVAGMPYYTGTSTLANQGAAYVFVKAGKNWASMYQTARLTAADPAVDALLGTSVAVSGNTIIAGSRGLSAGSVPAVYVFVAGSSGWTDMSQTAKLTASDNGLTGSTVGISGNTVVAGGTSSAYVFTRPPTGWMDMTQTAQLTGSAQSGLAGLGSSVAIDGNTVVVSAPATTVNGKSNAGAIAVYTEPITGWSNSTETAVLTNSMPVQSQALGPIAVSGNTVVAGDSGAIVQNHLNSGKVLVFVEPASGWINMTQTATLTPSDPTKQARLGWSVGVSGNTVIAGAPFMDINNHPNGGAIYVYTRPASGWRNMTETTRLNIASGGGGNLGFAVGIQGNTIVGSRPYTNGYVGAAQVYQQ